MWIMDQQRQMLINTNQITNVWIDRQRNYIKARLNIHRDDDRNVVILGHYEDEKLEKVFESLFDVLSGDFSESFKMPFSGDVK